MYYRMVKMVLCRLLICNLSVMNTCHLKLSSQWNYFFSYSASFLLWPFSQFLASIVSCFPCSFRGAWEPRSHFWESHKRRETVKFSQLTSHYFLPLYLWLPCVSAHWSSLESSSRYVETKDVVMEDTTVTTEEVSGEAVPPFFITKPIVQRLIEGGRIIFECQVGGNPKPHVYWKKGGVPLTTGYRYYLYKCTIYELYKHCSYYSL